MSATGNTPPRATRLVEALAVASLAVHLTVHYVQRKIYLTGLDNRVGGKRVLGAPADDARTIALLLANAALLVVAFGAYAWLVALCRRGRAGAAETRRILLAAPAAASLAAVFLRPYLSIDLGSYVFHGTLARDGVNPHVVPLYSLGSTSLAAELAPLGWRPASGASPYGPFQTFLERVVAALPASAFTQMIAFKLVMVACFLGTAAFIWDALARRPAAERLTAVVTFLWNPMVLIEVAVEGHNDASMSLFVVAAFAAAVHGRAGPSVVALGLAVLTKYVPVFLVLPLGVYLWRTQGRKDARGLARDVLIGGALSALVAVALFAPYWADGGAWRGLLSETGAHSYANGVGHAAVTLLHFDDRIHAVLLLATIGVMVWRSAKVRDENSLALAALVTMCVYDFVASRRIFAWYGVLPVALGALLPTRRVFWFVVAVSLPMSLAAPFQPVLANGALLTPGYLAAIAASQPFIGVFLPAAAFAVWVVYDSKRTARARRSRP